ncbi:MAG: hypothetical protein V7711_00065 [Pseudomonadales bacterium]
MNGLLQELKRRNVFRVGLAYLALAWVVIQITDIAVPALNLPESLSSIVFYLGLIAFPFALLFAWAFELTPEGLMRTADVDESQSVSLSTGRKLDFVVIGLMAIALLFMLWDGYLRMPEAPLAANTTVAGPVTTAANIRRSIAVLPFVNMSDDKDYFADGLSEEILNLLAKNRELKVAARTSSFVFKGKNQDLREIGQTLDVATVLEGSVRKSGSRLRITAQLINVADGYHIWSETYDRQMTDIFDMQDDIAMNIMNALEIHLDTDQPNRGRPTKNMQAYEKFLAAKALSREQWEIYQPIKLLKQAVALDPNFAEAWEALSIEYWTRSGAASGISLDEGPVLCFEAAEKALALDPGLSIAAAMSAATNPVSGGWHTELTALVYAYEKNPDDPMLLNAVNYVLLGTGYFSEALQVAEHWVSIDPLSPLALSSYADALWATGREEEALVINQQAFDLGEPNEALDQFIFYSIARDVDHAATIYIRFLKRIGEEAKGADSWIHAISSPDTGREKIYEFPVDKILGVNFGRWVFFLGLGHLDDFYDHLEKQYNPNAIWTFSDQIIQTSVLHRKSGFSAHPRYVPFMEKVGITAIWDERGAPDHCSKETGAWVCE